MRRVKTLFGTVLLVTLLCFNGEIYILYLDNFQNSFFQSSFSFETSATATDNSQIVRDFKVAAATHEVDFFFVNRKIVSAYYNEITIYGTEKAFDAIRTKGIEPGLYKSLFMGTVDVVFKPFDTIEAIKKYEACYYVGGDAEIGNLRAFKRELISPYGGGFPKLYGSDKELWSNLLTVWLLAFTMMLLMTVYELLNRRKEVAVRVVLGANLFKLFANYSAKDLIAYSVILIASQWVLSYVTFSAFKYAYLLLAFIGFLMVNTWIHSFIFNINFKKHLSSQRKASVLLGVNFTLKVLFTAMTLLILSSNFVGIMHGINLYKQRTFFETHRDYAYYNLSYKPDENRTYNAYRVLNNRFYRQYHDTSIQYTDYTQNMTEAYPIVFINQPAKEELALQYPFIGKLLSEKKFAVLVPEKVRERSEVMSFIQLAYEARFMGFVDRKPEPIYYSEELDMVAVDNRSGYLTTAYRNPIVFYYNSASDKILNQPWDFNVKSILFKISNKDFEAFVKENALEYEIASRSSAFEVYKAQWDTAFRNIRMLTVLSVLLLVLNLSLDVLIIQMSYHYNAVELALKKIYGYTLFSRHRRLILSTLFSAVFSILLTVLVFTFGINFVGHRKYLVYIGLGMMLIELIYIIRKVHMVERYSLVSILKGESI